MDVLMDLPEAPLALFLSIFHALVTNFSITNCVMAEADRITSLPNTSTQDHQFESNPKTFDLESVTSRLGHVLSRAKRHWLIAATIIIHIVSLYETSLHYEVYLLGDSYGAHTNTTDSGVIVVFW